MASGLATAPAIEKLPDFRMPRNWLSATARPPLPIARATADVGASMRADCWRDAAPAASALAPDPPATAVRLLSRRLGDGSARKAVVLPLQGALWGIAMTPCGGGSATAQAAAPLSTALGGTGAGRPKTAGRQPGETASLAGVAAVGEPREARRGWLRRGVTSIGMRPRGWHRPRRPPPPPTPPAAPG